MKGRYLLGSQPFSKEGNIFANRSSLVLNWLLTTGSAKEHFSIREVSKETGVSLGLVQRVFSTLVIHGYLVTQGLRTNKTFFLKSGQKLLKLWVDRYNILKKCKIHSYRSPFSEEEIMRLLVESKLQDSVALALHTSARAMDLANTNLKTVELYLLDHEKREKIEKLLKLTPSEKGYDVLLVKPYYRDWIMKSTLKYQGIKSSSPLLTFIELSHFPLRGIEQAEFLFKFDSQLKSIK